MYIRKIRLIADVGDEIFKIKNCSVGNFFKCIARIAQSVARLSQRLAIYLCARVRVALATKQNKNK